MINFNRCKDDLSSNNKTIKIIFKLKTFHFYNYNIVLPKIIKKISYFKNFTFKVISLPTKLERYTILRSPHVDKKSREQFELRKHSKILIISFNNNNLKEKQIAKVLINYIKNSTAGFSLKISYII